MYNAIILPPARDDIKDIVSWYNSKQKGLGKRFTKAIRSKVLIIRKNPNLYPIRYDDTHTAVLDSFPFMIHYSVFHDTKTVLISAVFRPPFFVVVFLFSIVKAVGDRAARALGRHSLPRANSCGRPSPSG